MRIHNLKQTCCAYPSQWEAETEDGQCVYIRYRWGELKIGVAPTMFEAIKTGEIVLYSGDPYGGYMETDQMLSLAELTLVGEGKEEGEGNGR